MNDYIGLGIPDGEFIRGQIPMTKKNIRILSVAKLNLSVDSVVYDVGAGTGSVTVEMAKLCSNGTVYAIEQKEEAISLIRQNVEKFELDNVEVVKGHAPEVMEDMPTPTHAFIGGTSGNLLGIVDSLRKKNPNVAIVINAVTLETLSEIRQLSKIYPEYKDMELLQVSISNIHEVGEYHMLQADNPIYIATLRT